MKRTELVRRTPLQPGGPLRRGGRVRAVSTRRVAEHRAYTAGKKAFLDASPVCQRCSAEPATDLHHRANRAQSRAAFLDPDNWVALGRRCHDFVTVNREAAVAEGFAQWGWDYRARGAS